jgi:AcrR family transcriptional regulator
MTKQPPGRVESTTAQRLREALATMVRQQDSGASPPALTATTLCELAGMSRNALYRYHPDVVQALRAAQQKHHPRIDGHRRAAQQLRQDNAVLREQIAKMAALVDHYFAAWQETRLLLQRRDRELAESRRDAKMRVVSIAPEHRGG